VSELEAIRYSIENLGAEIRNVREEDVKLATERHVETQSRLVTIETTLRRDYEQDQEEHKRIDDLDDRVNSLESWRDEQNGRGQVWNGVKAVLLTVGASAIALFKGCGSSVNHTIGKGHP
jgi:septal ring factor EnvC (AmiA/AmiB activator)